MTRLQCIPELLHWFTQATYWTLPIANLYHSSFKNSNTHNSLWLLRSKWTHQSIYVQWNPVSHSKYYSVTIVFPVQSPTIKPQGKSVSMNFLWQHLCSLSNSAVTNSISSEPQSPTRHSKCSLSHLLSISYVSIIGLDAFIFLGIVIYEQWNTQAWHI